MKEKSEVIDNFVQSALAAHEQSDEFISIMQRLEELLAEADSYMPIDKEHLINEVKDNIAILLEDYTEAIVSVFAKAILE